MTQLLSSRGVHISQRNFQQVIIRGDGNNQFNEIIAALNLISAKHSIIWPVHPRTKKIINEFDIRINSNIVTTDPFGYLDFMGLQKNAKLIITDSGGIQEESTFFGVPCLTIRENTERPITITQGTNKLIGIDYGKIPHEVDLVLAANEKEYTVPDRWDGKAAHRISAIIDDYFNNIL